MNTQDNEEEKKDVARTDIEQTDTDNQHTTGETSTVKPTDKTSFSGTPKRKSTSLGSSHEPGTTPGREF
jgi:hypothetical protein